MIFYNQFTCSLSSLKTKQSFSFNPISIDRCNATKTIMPLLRVQIYIDKRIRNYTSYKSPILSHKIVVSRNEITHDRPACFIHILFLRALYFVCSIMCRLLWHNICTKRGITSPPVNRILSFFNNYVRFKLKPFIECIIIFF